MSDDLAKEGRSVARDLNNGFPVTSERVVVVERMADRIEELEAKLSKIAQVFALLDVTEETEDGRVFHPTQIRSSRVLDAEKLGALLAELRDTLTANNKENSYAE